MQTKLDKLLSFISPEKTITETYNRANHAINTFHMNSAQISDWDEFRYCMGKFLQHVEAYILCLREPINVSWDYSWSRCAQLLVRVYKSSGEKTAFEMARTGNEGGLYSVLKAVAMRIADECSQNEISAKVCTYLNSLSVDEKFSACSEYISKYGYLLPSEITESNAIRIRANFQKVLENHPRLILKFRGVLR